jgi:hypothetical protein
LLRRGGGSYLRPQVTVVACCSMLVAAMLSFFLLQTRPVYLVDFAVHRPADRWAGPVVRGHDGVQCTGFAGASGRKRTLCVLGALCLGPCYERLWFEAQRAGARGLSGIAAAVMDEFRHLPMLTWNKRGQSDSKGVPTALAVPSHRAR